MHVYNINTKGTRNMKGNYRSLEGLESTACPDTRLPSFKTLEDSQLDANEGSELKLPIGTCQCTSEDGLKQNVY